MISLYWRKIRSDMAMASDLKAMHRAKPESFPVYGPPDADGRSAVIGTRVESAHYSIPRRERHRLAMGSR